MKSLLLLVISLTAGGETDVRGCTDGWLEFTCKVPQGYRMYRVVKDKQTVIQSTNNNIWENRDRFYLCHDTNTEELKVVIRQLERPDSGDYECVFTSESKERKNKKKKDEVELKVGVDYRTPLIQTAYSGAKFNISCDYKRRKDDSRLHKFFCKHHNETHCEESTNKPLTDTENSITMSIRNVSSEHAGDCWCGLEERIRRYRSTLRKIQLEVKNITTFTRFPTVGQTLTYWCKYPPRFPPHKFICKGEDPSSCVPVVTSLRPKGRFSMNDNKRLRIITVTVTDVRTEDTGTYWCGADIITKSPTKSFLHRLDMTVVPSHPSTPSTVSSTSPHPVATSSLSSTQSTTASAESNGGSRLTVTIVGVAVPVVLIILVLGYKRLQHLKTKRDEDQDDKDRAYEEIEEHPQKPGAGTALKTIYNTANTPTNPSATEYYSTINLSDSSGKASGDTYATVRENDQHPTYSTVNHPSRLYEDPFYSTVNNPQQH